MRFIRLHDYTWWIWLVIASGLLAGMLVSPVGLWVALAICAVQAIAFLIKERSLKAFPVQLRVGYLLIIGVFAIPVLRVLLWIPMIGTFVLCFSGYCMMARLLSLLPWNRTTPLTLRDLVATFTVAPDLSATNKAQEAASCPGGVCTLDVQLARLRRTDKGL